MVDVSDLHARGLRRRGKMFGEADVAKRMAAAGDFGAPLQDIINAYVYGDVWERSGLSDPIRSLVMLGITAASSKTTRVPRPCQGRAGQWLHRCAGAGRDCCWSRCIAACRLPSRPAKSQPRYLARCP